MHTTEMPLRHGCRRPQKGYSLVELLVVVAVIGIATLVAMAGWRSYQVRAQMRSSARVMDGAIRRARFLAVSKGINHFVVVDPSKRLVSIYADNTVPTNSFNTGTGGDQFISSETYASSVSVALPAAPSPLPNPFDTTTNLASAWAIPDPDSSAGWGTSLKGFMTSPNGRFMSGEATPAIIDAGVIVLSDPTGATLAIGLRGQFGTIKKFDLRNGSWIGL